MLTIKQIKTAKPKDKSYRLSDSLFIHQLIITVHFGLLALRLSEPPPAWLMLPRKLPHYCFELRLSMAYEGIFE
ncbi:hypothetical protein O7C57_08370 [Providencia sp. 21OH12SH02B-Prov]|uniref:hypothetical protein n=1 Tax=unclassified Providencia TaxID=2633465 RepID=UPI0022B7065A|nr:MULTISPECIES: hypothetical protein [unclassified Providencia]ELR5119476.1 hypothetical protein [Providencia stuartii]WBA58564.1 hypothetical protein O7C57_08370 [Providencia sp. 21OH12SH02B-Prov]